MFRALCVALVCSIVIPSVALADYTLRVEVEGPGSVIKNPGDTFVIDFFVISTDANDLTNDTTSVIFDVGFTQDDLLYEGYEWKSPYDTEGAYDWSQPSSNDENWASGTPIPAWTPSTTQDPAIPSVHFENFLDSGYFTEGALLSLTVTIPPDATWNSVQIFPLTDTFMGDAGEVATRNGNPAIVYLPEPASMSLLAIGGLAMLRRRRR